MDGVLLAIALLAVGAFGALACSRLPRCSSWIGIGGAVSGSVVGLIEAVHALVLGRSESFSRPWSIPGGSLSLGLDPLSAWFLLPIFFVTAVAAVYGGGYLRGHRSPEKLGFAWFMYNSLTVSMSVVVLARNAVLFLVAWEIMSLSSYMLVTFDDEDEKVCEAGRNYLVAMHLGTAFLLVFFLLLGRQAGSLDFASVLAAGPQPARRAGVLFVLALVGFGTKVGFMPFHVWLPDAHPAAPSFVSAVMSAVMVKTGVYGIVRTLMFLPAAPAWWGWLLVGIGSVSGVWGILHALTQHDAKRLLAYSTVENVGIIALGLGMGVLGVASGRPLLAVLGYAGALLHVLNHAALKGLMFLSVGAIAHATGTRDMDRLGGLAKRMPLLAGVTILGAVAIAGLPPLNGFFGEFLIFLAAFRDDALLPVFWAVPALLVISALGLIGGLAAATFSKLVGSVLLGEPRSTEAAQPHRLEWMMAGPMVLLSTACVACAVLAPGLVTLLVPIAGQVAGSATSGGVPPIREVVAPVRDIVVMSGVLLALLAALAVLRHRLLSGREVTQASTWDCGYALPTARMQYTGSSLVQPLTGLFAEVLHVRTRLTPPQGLFPRASAVETEPVDVCREHVYSPVFERGGTLIRKLRWIQQGTTHVYILYIALTLLLLLLWCLGFGLGG